MVIPSSSHTGEECLASDARLSCTPLAQSWLLWPHSLAQGLGMHLRVCIPMPAVVVTREGAHCLPWLRCFFAYAHAELHVFGRT